MEKDNNQSENANKEANYDREKCEAFEMIHKPREINEHHSAFLSLPFQYF